VIARRTPRAPGEQAELGQDAHWRYGAFATATAAGQVQWLDARHRTQAHVEDKICATKRGAISLAQRGEIGGISLDPMADPEPKGKNGDDSMPGN
jgi:hypothetical protein